MKKILLFPVIAVFAVFSSCDSWINVIPDNVATIDDAFKDRISVEQAISTCYSYLNSSGTQNDATFLCGDDLQFRLDLNVGSGQFVQPALSIAINGNNASRPIMSNWHATEGGKAYYQAIRYCNYVIKYAHQVRDCSKAEILRYIAEAKVLKAYYHYALALQYGPVPIVDIAYDPDIAPEESLFYRNTMDEVIDYIDKTILEAVPDLPMTLDMIKEAGRIGAPQALCIRAKALVLGASPLFNGNKNYEDLVDNRGIKLVNTTYDPKKWEYAAQACKEAIDICEEAGFALYRIPNATLSGLSELTRQIVTVSAITSTRWNEEQVWGINQGYDNDKLLSNHTRARLNQDQMNSVTTHYFPTLKMDEMFYTSNGVPINEDKDFDYDNRYELTTVPATDALVMQPGVTTVKLHLNREPRFYGNLGVDGGWWFGLGRLDENNQWPLNFVQGSYSGGRIGSDRYSSTGLYIKKWTPWEDSFAGQTLVHKGFNWTFVRLADMYLLYAEALNESLESPNADVYHYVNLIRERAGLESVEKSWTEHSTKPDKYKTKEGMREIIHQERNIELAFEGHRFCDIRRWGEAVSEFNKPFQGWNADYGTTKESLHQVVTFTHKPYGMKDILWPIMTSELTRNPNLVQNPGWNE